MLRSVGDVGLSLSASSYSRTWACTLSNDTMRHGRNCSRSGVGDRVDALGRSVPLLQWSNWATIAVGDDPVGVAFDGTHIWVTNYLNDTVSKIAVG
jgi:DNA-binding beta-propeller fold protein YncE